MTVNNLGHAEPVLTLHTTRPVYNCNPARNGNVSQLVHQFDL